MLSRRQISGATTALALRIEKKSRTERFLNITGNDLDILKSHKLGPNCPDVGRICLGMSLSFDRNSNQH